MIEFNNSRHIQRLPLRCDNQDERGFFTIWVLGLCVCVLFVGGLSLDLWRGFTERRQLAAIADAAAVAGASQISLDAFKASPSAVQLDPAAAKLRATQYIQKAVADEGLDLTSFDTKADQSQIVVSVESRLHMSLTRILSPGREYTVSAESTAEPRVSK